MRKHESQGARGPRGSAIKIHTHSGGPPTLLSGPGGGGERWIEGGRLCLSEVVKVLERARRKGMGVFEMGCGGRGREWSRCGVAELHLCLSEVIRNFGDTGIRLRIVLGSWKMVEKLKRGVGLLGSGLNSFTSVRGD